MICPHADRIPGLPCAYRACHAKAPRLGQFLVTADGRQFELMVRVKFFGRNQRPAYHFFWEQRR